MPTRRQIVADVTRLLDNASYPKGITGQTAWLGIYQALLWYEPVGLHGFEALPHVIDADKLRPSASREPSRRAGAWQVRAQAVEAYVASELGCPPGELRQRVDQLMRLPEYVRLQRQNPLGTAFSGAIKHVLESFGHSALSYDLEVDATKVFPGIRMPWRSTTPKMDILVLQHGHFPEGRPIAILSTKWSLRHDRINDVLGECPEYKSAALKRRLSLRYFVVTNEFDPARLAKVLSDPCIDGLVHVHRHAVTGICGLDGRLEKMLDLSDFVAQTRSWV